MQRELTFYPETERTRDLVYSEYTSCDRSIHVLLQDNSVPQYHFLLEAYREIVARYLSTSRIQSPLSFAMELSTRLDELARMANVTVNDFKSMGVFVVLRGAQGYLLLTSRPEDVFMHGGGETLPLLDTLGSGAERVRFSGGVLQEELFPENVTDCLLAFNLDPVFFRDRDIVLGCGEENKSTVLEALSDPLWLATNDRRNSLVSKFMSCRVLALRFDDTLPQVVAGNVTASRIKRVFRQRGAPVVAAAAAALIIAYFATDLLLPNRGLQPQTVSPNEAGGQRGTELMSPPAEEPIVENTTLLTQNWRKNCAEAVTSSPVLYEKWVIFGSRDGNTYALERESGESLWIVKSPDGIGASPAVSEGDVVIADYQGNVSALSARNGALRWQQKLPMRIVSSPSVMEGKVLVGCYDGYAYCMSMKDGSVLWRQRTQGRIRASTAASQGRFYVASYDGYLYAIDGTGKVEWRYQLNGQIASSPVVHHDLVIIGAPDGRVHAVDAAQGSLRWQYSTGGAVKSAAVVHGGLVYIGSNDKHLYCLNGADGSEVWKFKTDDIVLAQARVSEGVVYVGSYDGFLYSLDARTGKLLDRFQTDSEIYSSPVVDQDSVYFGTNKGDFICLNHRNKKAL
ncbi:MAG: PQQ-binding-like beta-propeller repeat protein [Candidatus Krumholzibacteria bacterium]|nr:PQQ-binding-like beta-propeller repeat protein [Candidatus Krumholzibacteria bacterium]